MAGLISGISFRLNSIHLGVDALSQITVLLTPQQKFKGQIARYYANVSMHLFELAKITGQNKEDIIFCLNPIKVIDCHQTYNLADKLGKFDLEKDTSDLWVKHTKAILNPPWLQLPRKSFFPDLLKQSKSAIDKHRA